jgi:hypothetical protein
MKATRTISSPCPHCGKSLDGATDPTGGAVPSPGDLTLCVYCAGVSIFGEDMQLRTATEEEEMMALPMEQLQSIAAYKKLLQPSKALPPKAAWKFP